MSARRTAVIAVDKCGEICIAVYCGAVRVARIYCGHQKLGDHRPDLSCLLEAAERLEEPLQAGPMRAVLTEAAGTR